eukprot:UN13973
MTDKLRAELVEEVRNAEIKAYDTYMGIPQYHYTTMTSKHPVAMIGNLPAGNAWYIVNLLLGCSHDSLP